MYREVNVQEYAQELLARGAEPIQAEKAGRIHARVGVVGEEVISWSEDKDGNPIQERVATVKLDPETGKPGHVVTKLGEDGLPVIDRNGHTNTWIIGDKKFTDRYQLDPAMGDDIYMSSAGIQIFLPILDDVVIEQWGKKEQIAAGGYINITNPEDMYGISARDFADTYEIIPGEDNKTM